MRMLSDIVTVGLGAVVLMTLVWAKNSSSYRPPPGVRTAIELIGNKSARRYWLYADGEPVGHLIPGDGAPVDRAGETIDHVAFRLTGHDLMRRKLDGLSIAYSRMGCRRLATAVCSAESPPISSRWDGRITDNWHIEDNLTLSSR
jgi:hypothetical protein